MIPKKIHYVRIGGKKMPELAKRCIKSWERYLPEYEICLWNEKNFDLNSNLYAKDAYRAKKFAYVWDYIRIRAMYTYGGISMDTDVEVLKRLDVFLNSKGFSGFEDKNLIPTGIMASEKGNPFIGDILEWYKRNKFDPQCSYTNVAIITKIATEKYGFKGGCNELVKLENNVFEFYPKNYFCPISYTDPNPNYKKCINDENCYTIHRFSGSWLPRKKRIKMYTEKKLIHISKKFHFYNFAKKIYNMLLK